MANPDRLIARDALPLENDGGNPVRNLAGIFEAMRLEGQRVEAVRLEDQRQEAIHLERQAECQHDRTYWEQIHGWQPDCETCGMEQRTFVYECPRCELRECAPCRSARRQRHRAGSQPVVRVYMQEGALG